jgi:uncharacterized sulfatase
MEKQKVGTTNAASVLAAFDLVPSMLEIAGVAAPVGTDFDGEAMADVLLGRSDRSRATPLFWRRPPDRKIVSSAQPERLPDLAMRVGNWKLLCDYDGSAAQLYEMDSDREERHDLAQQQSAVVVRMTAAVRAWNDKMPADKGPELGAEAAKAKGKGKKKAK